MICQMQREEQFEAVITSIERTQTIWPVVGTEKPIQRKYLSTLVNTEYTVTVYSCLFYLVAYTKHAVTVYSSLFYPLRWPESKAAKK